MTARRKPKTCSRCLGPNDRPPYRYCSVCHAGYMRRWRTGQATDRAVKDADLLRLRAELANLKGTEP